jgi:hypothetical protein
MLRRSARIAARVKAHPDAAQHSALKPSEVLDIFLAGSDTLWTLEKLVEERFLLHRVNRVSDCETLHRVWVDFQWLAHDAVQRADLEMPFMVFAKKAARTFVDFVGSLKYDNAEGYIFKEIYPIFCARMIKGIMAEIKTLQRRAT